jgi:predicted  nucleic acid-binding Zn-ribbon protein
MKNIFLKYIGICSLLIILFSSCFKDDLLKEIDALKTQVSDMKKRNDSLNNVLNIRADSLAKALTSAQKRSDSLSNVLRTKSDSLSLALGLTNVNLANLTKSVDSIKVQVANINGQLTQLNSQLTIVTTQLTQLNQQFGALGADYAALNAKYQELSATLQELNTQIAALQAEQLKLLERLNSITLQLNPPVDINTGLVAYYPFSGNAGDSSGNGNHGTVFDVMLTPDRFGISQNAYLFNGVSSYIDITKSFFDNSWSDYTISFWIKPTSVLSTNGPGQTILNTNPHRGLGLGFSYFDSKKLYHFNQRDSYSSNWDLGDDKLNFNVTLNNWINVTLKKSNNQFSYYVNGVFDKSTPITYTTVSFLYSMRIGAISCCTPENFNGSIDDIRFYKRALTQSEITYLASH